MQKHPAVFPTLAAVLALACAGAAAPAASSPAVPGNAATPAHSHSQRYTITDLGTLRGGTFSQATATAFPGLVVGGSLDPDGFEQAVLWLRGHAVGIGPKGMNSDAFGVNVFGQVSGLTETAAKDPNGENFCGYGTDRRCRPFLWQSGRMRLLPLLGGNNGTVGNVNLLGQVAGAAQTGQVDPACPKAKMANGIGPLVLQYKPVIWGPKPDTVRELRTLPGDSVGVALGINDLGEVVGATGTCANMQPPPFVFAPHAVLWKRDGSPVNLGNLGGAGDPQLGTGTSGFAINNRGQVVGVSVLGDNKTSRGFIWTHARKMRALEPAAGHPASAALAINNRGDVVGASGTLPFDDPNAAIWPRGGAALDLNQLVAKPTPLHLLTAFAISDVGEIAGFALDTDSGQIHAFLATPVRGR